MRGAREIDPSASLRTGSPSSPRFNPSLQYSIIPVLQGSDTLERGDRAQRSRWAFFNSLLTFVHVISTEAELFKPFLFPDLLAGRRSGARTIVIDVVTPTDYRWPCRIRRSYRLQSLMAVAAARFLLVERGHIVSAGSTANQRKQKDNQRDFQMVHKISSFICVMSLRSPTEDENGVCP
jgi:hypothetical protein